MVFGLGTKKSGILDGFQYVDNPTSEILFELDDHVPTKSRGRERSDGSETPEKSNRSGSASRKIATAMSKLVPGKLKTESIPIPVDDGGDDEDFESVCEEVKQPKRSWRSKTPDKRESNDNVGSSPIKVQSALDIKFARKRPTPLRAPSRDGLEDDDDDDDDDDESSERLSSLSPRQRVTNSEQQDCPSSPRQRVTNSEQPAFPSSPRQRVTSAKQQTSLEAKFAAEKPIKLQAPSRAGGRDEDACSVRSYSFSPRRLRRSNKKSVDSPSVVEPSIDSSIHSGVIASALSLFERKTPTKTHKEPQKDDLQICNGSLDSPTKTSIFAWNPMNFHSNSGPSTVAHLVDESPASNGNCEMGAEAEAIDETESKNADKDRKGLSTGRKSARGYTTAPFDGTKAVEPIVIPSHIVELDDSETSHGSPDVMTKINENRSEQFNVANESNGPVKRSGKCPTQPKKRVISSMCHQEISLSGSQHTSTGSRPGILKSSSCIRNNGKSGSKWFNGSTDQVNPDFEQEVDHELQESLRNLSVMPKSSKITSGVHPLKRSNEISVTKEGDQKRASSRDRQRKSSNKVQADDDRRKNSDATSRAEMRQRSKSPKTKTPDGLISLSPEKELSSRNLTERKETTRGRSKGSKHRDSKSVGTPNEEDSNGKDSQRASSKGSRSGKALSSSRHPRRPLSSSSKRATSNESLELSSGNQSSPIKDRTLRDDRKSEDRTRIPTRSMESTDDLATDTTTKSSSHNKRTAPGTPTRRKIVVSRQSKSTSRNDCDLLDTKEVGIAKGTGPSTSAFSDSFSDIVVRRTSSVGRKSPKVIRGTRRISGMVRANSASKGEYEKTINKSPSTTQISQSKNLMKAFQAGFSHAEVDSQATGDKTIERIPRASMPTTDIVQLQALSLTQQ